MKTIVIIIFICFTFSIVNAEIIGWNHPVNNYDLVEQYGVYCTKGCDKTFFLSGRVPKEQNTFEIVFQERQILKICKVCSEAVDYLPACTEQSIIIPSHLDTEAVSDISCDIENVNLGIADSLRIE